MGVMSSTILWPPKPLLRLDPQLVYDIIEILKDMERRVPDMKKNKRLGLREISQIGQEAELEAKPSPFGRETDVTSLTKEDVNKLLEISEKEIELLESDIVEVVMETDQEKTFEINTDLLHIDDEHQLTRHALYSRCVPIFENPVTVVDSSNKIIGSAVLEMEGKTLVCKMFIDYATPERLEIETGMHIFPHIIGHSRVETWATKNRIREFYIESIMLTNGNTFDPRIGKITK